MPSNRADLLALRSLICEAELLLSTTILPEGRAERALEILRAAAKLADYLTTTKPAVTLGKKGGMRTAERGPDYFRKIASMRKTKAGGRPKKRSQ